MLYIFFQPETFRSSGSAFLLRPCQRHCNFSFSLSFTFCVSAKPHNYNNCSACRGCTSVCRCICGYKDVYVYMSVSFEGTCANMANCGNDCHMHSPQTSERVHVCECVSVCCCPALCRLQLFLLSLLPTCLSLPPCSKLVHTRVLDVPISSSDAKQKISACCTLLPRP